MKPQQRDLSSSHERDCPTPPHPNVQRSISNVMKPENTVKTKGKRKWCKKKSAKGEKHCKNQCKWTKAENITRRNSCSCPPPLPPPPSPRAALSRSRKHCKTQYKMHIQQCVCAWTPHRREQPKSRKPHLMVTWVKELFLVDQRLFAVDKAISPYSGC